MEKSLEEKILDIIRFHNPKNAIGLNPEFVQQFLKTDYHESFELKDLTATMNQMTEAGKLKAQPYFHDHVCYALA